MSFLWAGSPCTMMLGLVDQTKLGFSPHVPSPPLLGSLWQPPAAAGMGGGWWVGPCP